MFLRLLLLSIYFCDFCLCFLDPVAYLLGFPFQTDNLERPLLYENVDHHLGERYDMPGSFPEASRIQIDGDTAATKVQGFVRESQFQPIDTSLGKLLSFHIWSLF